MKLWIKIPLVLGIIIILFSVSILLFFNLNPSVLENFFVLILVLLAIAVILCGFFLGKSITKSITGLAGIIKENSKGEVDLTKNIVAFRNDEIGELGEILNQARENVKDHISAIKYKINALTNTGYEITMNMGKIIKSLEEISSGLDSENPLSKFVIEMTASINFMNRTMAENNKNFEVLKKETNKFNITTGEEKQKVMVIDDDETHLEMTASFLESFYDVFTALSCDEALKLLHEGFAPDFILLDLIMPEVDGWDTFDRIKELSKLHHVPIAIFTSSDDPSDIEYARKMGAADYIRKPCKRRELLERIGKILNRDRPIRKYNE